MRSKLIYILFTITLIYGCSSGNNEIIISKVNPNAENKTSGKDFNSFWENISRFQIGSIDTALLDKSYKTFLNGFNAVVNSETENAKIIFSNLLTTGDNAEIKINSKKILADLLFNNSQWKELINISEKIKKDAEKELNIEMIKAFDKSKSEVYKFPPNAETLLLSLSKSGSPILTAKINGKEINLWIDTGAELSVLSSDIAETIGIVPLVSNEQEASTATAKKIKYSPAIIDSLEIGLIKIKNHPIIILQKEDLEFSFLAGLIKIKIDGIIGWNAIRNFDLILNFPEKKVTINKPSPKNVKDKNLFWLGYPYVVLLSEEGIPLCFGLDTGAKNSSLTKNIYSKINFENIESTTESIGGAGGFEDVKVDIIPHLTIQSGNNLITLNKIKSLPAKLYSIIKHDGIIGSDLFSNSIIKIDFLNGLFEIIHKEVK